MKIASKHSSFTGLLLLALISCSSSHALSACHGCVPEHLLRSEAYGIDLSLDYLAVAVQHVNGTLQPVAKTSTGPQYQSLMSRLLMESDIYPYGYGNDRPEHILSYSRVQLVNADINVLSEEIAKIVSIVQDQDRNIRHYTISIPAFFTPSNEKQVLIALQRSNLPEPSGSQPVDFAAFAALNTTRCQRHFEFNCRAIDYNPRTIIFLEYSKSTLSGFLYHFWGGWYFNRVAYFSDARLGDRTRGGNQGHWEAVTHRIKALVEDNKDKIAVRRLDSVPLDVVVLGQLAFDPLFHQAVRDALSSYTNGHILPPMAQESTFLDPPFVSALGGARGAKRSIDRPRPRGCNVEDLKCTKIREKILHDSFVRQSLEGDFSKEF